MICFVADEDIGAGPEIGGFQRCGPHSAGGA